MSLGPIKLRGIRQNNLQGFDVEIPRGSLTSITGVSGSGKSSLAFDTLFREGQRRFLETLSRRGGELNLSGFPRSTCAKPRKRWGRSRTSALQMA